MRTSSENLDHARGVDVRSAHGKVRVREKLTDEKKRPGCAFCSLGADGPRGSLLCLVGILARPERYLQHDVAR